MYVLLGVRMLGKGALVFVVWSVCATAAASDSAVYAPAAPHLTANLHGPPLRVRPGSV
jgi:hypothetical protein